MRFFFYGTLRDTDVRAHVLGRHLPGTAVEPAWLKGYVAVYRAGATYPVLRPAANEETVGLLASHVTRADCMRLCRFEGSAYSVRTITVRTLSRDAVSAKVFMAKPGIIPSDTPWHFEAWQRHFKRHYLTRVRA